VVGVAAELLVAPRGVARPGRRLAAAAQVGGAPTAGFTESVSGAAARFASTWQRHTDGLADEAEERGDALRRVIADFLATDRAVRADVLGLVGYLGEQR